MSESTFFFIELITGILGGIMIGLGLAIWLGKGVGLK